MHFSDRRLVGADQRLVDLPHEDRPQHNAALRRFSTYVWRTWLAKDKRLAMFNHWNTQGPRTTNHAEGYHSALKHTFHGCNPAFNTFLDWLQKRNFEAEVCT